MKKFFILFLVALSVLLVTSCETRNYVDVPNNMYAIVVPADGDTTQQGQLDSFEKYKDTLVSGKRIMNPDKRYDLGGGSYVKKPAYNIYMVSRNPISRKWTSETKYGQDGSFNYVKTGDTDGIATETRGSAGIMLGFNITYYVTNPVAYLWWQRDNSDLAIFGDTTIRNTLQKITNEEVVKYPDNELTLNKSQLTASILKRLNDYYSKDYGITIKELGLVGGVQFDNPEVQKQIDTAMIQKMALNAVSDQLSTFKKKQELVEYERTWIDIDMKKAIIKYINNASEKGYVIFPSVTGSNTAMDISKYMK